MKSLAALSLKSREQRLEVLKENEDELEEQKKKDANLNDDEEGEEEAKDNDIEGDNEDEDDDAGNLLVKNKKKNDEDDLDNDYGDEEEDSDYEYTGGDLAIYDSALDAVDELLYIKEALESVNAANPQYMATIMSAMGGDDLAKFNENMSSA